MEKDFIIGVLGDTNLVRMVRNLASDLPAHSVEQAAEDFAPYHVLLAAVSEHQEHTVSEFVADLLSRTNGIPVVAVLRNPHYDIAVKAMTAGAANVVAVPEERMRLHKILEDTIAEYKRSHEVQKFTDAEVTRFNIDKILGTSPSLKFTKRIVEKAIENEALTVLVLGETGTGKGLLTRALHYNSANRQEPFVEIHCSSIPETLLESELFGHEKGAFTDARQRKIGLFEAAGGGTVFLDEIGDISLATQSKLLRVVEEKKMRRLGGISDINVNARIITATSKDLHALIAQGLFRRDLYYRLSVVTIELPPLRERAGDIPQLAGDFLAHFCGVYGRDIHGFTPSAMEYLKSRKWEGNIRELKHSIERAVVLVEGTEISEEDLHISTGAIPAVHKAVEHIPDAGVTNDEIRLDLTLSEASLTYVEKRVLRDVLKRVQWNKSRAASILKISRPRLDRLIKQDPDFFSEAL